MYAPIDRSAYWDEKYKKDEAAWNLKSANPVFQEFLENSDIIKPGKLLVAGCGKGYDAVLAAEKGYKVTAVDFSSSAISFAKQLALQSGVKIEFLQEDFFNLNDNYLESFDIVYEYTTYCAINPYRREEFADKISFLLKRKGRFVSILFPVEDREGGPPFGIDIKEFYKNFSRHLQLEFSSRQINSVKPRKGKEILQVYFKK